MMNRAPDSSAPIMEIPLGAIVYDVDGEKVGTVTFSTLHTGYIVVEKGWLFTHELYLPASAIELLEADWVKLRLSKEELKQDRWKTPPSENLQGASPKAMDEESAALVTNSAEDGRMRPLPSDEGRPLAGEPREPTLEEEQPPLPNH